MSETQTKCLDCGDTGFVPPFMDPCACGVKTAEIIKGSHDTEAPYLAYWLAVADAKPAAATVVMPPTVKAPKPGEKIVSDAQKNLLAKLTAERDHNHPVVKAYIAKLDEHTAAAVPMTAKAASKWITSLLEVHADPAKKTDVKPNFYDGVCKNCGGQVAAKAGRVEKIAGKWTTFHLNGECLSAEAAAAVLADKVTEPGLYKHTFEDGTDAVFRVRWNKMKTRLYGEKVVPPAHKDGEVHFEYNAKAMGFLAKSGKLTWEQARAFGAAYGACIDCGKTLKTDQSLVQGFGPKCADNNHWPTVTAKEAKAIIAGLLTWEAAIADFAPATS